MISPEDIEKQKDPSIVDADLILLFSQIHAFFSQGLQQKLSHSPISADGLWFLSTIMMLGGEATQSQLVKWMVRKQNSVSGMTKRLEEKGFVTKKRVRGANNRVCIKIVLTKRGKQFLKGRWGTSLVKAIFSHFTFDEKQQLRYLLLRAREAAAQEVSGYEEPPFPSPENASPDWFKLR